MSNKLTEHVNERITKQMSRNIYIGGTLFSFLLLLGLTVDTVRQTPKREHRENLTEEVIHGKEIWEKNNCVGCHTILGEGAYYAPELGNVYKRRGAPSEQAFKIWFGAWMNSRPGNVEGRRKMPQFNLTAEEINDVAEFLIWTSKIDTNNWPPNNEG